MNKPFPSVRIAASVALVVGCGIAAFAPLRAAQTASGAGATPAPPAGQAGAASPGATTPENGTSASDLRPVGNTPNPLIIADPSRRVGNPTTYYDRSGFRRDPEARNQEFQDYRGQNLGRERANQDRALPYYGYNFFEPARRLIEARREYLRRRFEQPQNQQPTPTAPATPGAVVPPGTETAPATGAAASSVEARYREQLARQRGEEYIPPASAIPGANAGTMPGVGTPTAPGTAIPGTATAPGTGMAPIPGQETTAASPATTGASGGGTAPGGPSVETQRSADAFNQVVDPQTSMVINPITSIPPNYQLAPGDVLNITYGTPTRTTREFRATIDSQGRVQVEGIGPVVVRGLSVEQAERAIRTRLTTLYREPTVMITLSELRTMQVTVSGEAYAPGTYTVPVIATAFNVLYAAGGPTTEGTLRRVEVRRRGVRVDTLDLYKFMREGSQTGDFPLQPGDMIYIPPRLSRVTVDGEVRNPAIFELIEGETLSDALRYADGVKPSAVDQRIQISSVDPGVARVLRDVDLRDRAQLARIPLYDGDVVEAFSVRETLANRVTVEGAVDQPGEYALTEGMRVSDLINRARGPLSEASLNRADLYRWNPDNTQTLIPVDLDRALAGDAANNVALTRWDRLRVYARSEVSWTGNREVTLRGAVQRPGVYYRSQNMRVSDLLLLAGGPTPDAYQDRAVLLHQRPDGTFGYDYIRLSEAIRGDASQNPVLQDNDVLAVYRHDEAQFSPERTVSIRGLVVAPGVYPRGENMRVSDLLRLAGGFRPGAGPRVTVAHARRSTDDPATALTTTAVEFDSQGHALRDDVELRDGDVVTIQGTGGFRDQVQIVTIQGAVNRPGPVVLSSNKMRLSDAIREAGGLRPEAYPEGVEFYRDPTLLATAGQKSMAQLISSLNDLLNQSTYQREQAKSDIELIKATGAATAESGSALAPLTGGDGAPKTNPAAASLAGSLARRDLVSAPRVLDPNELSPNGNIAVNLADALRRPDSSDDILLVNGDTITVPERPSTVQVVGAVYNARGVLFKPGERLDYYVAAAGGYTMDAALDRIVVIRAGGGILPAKQTRDLKPGDVVVVPTRVLAEKISSNRNGLDSLFRGIANSAIIYRLATGIFGL